MRTYRVGWRGISWSVVAAWLLVGLVGAPALATSCVGHPDASPAAILAGEERLAVDGGFDAWYRGAVLGTVKDVDTDEREGSATYGQTVVRLEVLGTFRDAAASEVEVYMADPGWMNGYGFAPGETYFVPVPEQASGVMACEPITMVHADEVDGLVAQLDAPAASTLLTIGLDEITVTPAAAAADGHGGGGGVPGWLWVAVAGVVVAGAIGVTALVSRH